MRYILALMIAVPLLLAGSAWAGTYDDEWSGNTVIECGRYSAKEGVVRFSVEGGVVEGKLHEATLSGSLEGHRIKGKVFGFSIGPEQIIQLSGSLRTGKLTAYKWKDDNIGPRLFTFSVQWIKASPQKNDTADDGESKDKASGSSEFIKAKLKELKDLLDEGLITEEEAAAKRSRPLEDL